MIWVRSLLVREFRGLKNYQLTFTPSPDSHLTILEGPNEAGKTTLLRFVRAALFGVEAAEGHLILEKDGRAYRIEVSGKKNRTLTDLESGNTLPAHTLSEMLGAVDHKVFENVFAFGLGELQELGTLTSGCVQEKIFAAGVAGAGPSARKAIKTLEGELQDLLKPMAKSRLKDHAQDLGELKARLRQAEQDANQYQVLLQERTRHQNHLASLHHQKLRLQQQFSHLERLTQCWNTVWAERMVAHAQLGQLPAHPQVTTEVLQDCERQEQHLQDLLDRKDALDEVSSRLSQHLDFTVDDDLLSQELPIRALVEEAALQHSRLSREADLEIQKEKLSRDALQALQKLPLSWTRERLLSWQDAGWEDTLQHQLQEHQRSESLLQTLQLQHHDLAEKARQAALNLQDHPVVTSLENPPSTGVEKQLREALLRARNRHQEQHQQLQAQQVDLRLLSKQLEIEALHQKHTQAHLNLQTQQQLSQDLVRNAEDTRLALTRIQPWKVEEVLAFEQDALWRKEASDFAHQLRAAQLREEASRQHLERQQQEVQGLSVRLQHTPAPKATLDPTKLQEQDMRIAAARARLQEETSLLSGARPGPIAPPPFPRNSLVVLFVAVLVSIFTWQLSWLLSVLVIAAGMVAGFLLRPAAAPSPETGLGTAATERIKKLREELKLDFQTLGLPADGGLADLDRLLVQLKSQQNEHQQGRSQQEAHEKLQQELQAALQLQENAWEQHQQATLHLQTLQHDWQQWTSSRNLRLHHPDDLTEFLASVTQAQQLLAGQQNRRKQHQHLTEELYRFREEVRPLLETFLQEAPAEIPQVLSAIQNLHLQLQEALRVHSRLQDQQKHLEHLSHEVEDAQKQLDAARFNLQEQHLSALRAHENAQKDLQHAVLQLQQAQNTQQHLSEHFHNWAEKHHLVSTHPIDARAELLMVQDASRRLQSLTQAEHELHHLESRISSFELTACNVLQLTGRTVNTGGFELLEAVRQAARDLEEAQKLQQDRQLTARKMLEVDQERQDIEKRCHHIRQQLRSTYDLLEVQTFSELQDHWKIQQERQRLEQQVQEASLYVHRFSGQHAEALIQELNLVLPVEWSTDQQKLQEELQDLHQQVEDLHRQLAQLDVKLQQLEESASSTELKQQFEQKQTQLLQDARAWVVRKLAHRLLAGTLKEYERTKGPEVLRHASEVFTSITEGRYQRVRANDNHTQLRIFQDDEQPLDVLQLSRGTQEQLYLSVRLGLARVLGERTVRLPLIMDDVLVNADPERANGLAHALSAVSQDHQIIYLTCHPDHTRLLQAAQPSAQVLRLQRLQTSGQWLGPDTPVMQDLTANHIVEYLVREREPRSAEQIRLALNAEQGALSALLSRLTLSGEIDRSGQRRNIRYAVRTTPGLIGD